MPNTKKSVTDPIAFANTFLRRDYLQHMDQADIVSPWVTKAGQDLNIRLVHIDALLYDSSDKISQKLNTLWSTVEGYGETVMLILNGKKDRVDFYLGISTQQSPQPVFNTFRRSLNGLFPGCKYTTLHNEAVNALMEDILPIDENLSIAALGAMPSENREPNDAGQKLDVLIDGMRHRPFSLILLAKAVPAGDLAAMRQLHLQLYTELSSHERSTVTLSKSDSESTGESFSESITKTIGYNASLSRGHSITKGTSSSEQRVSEAAWAQEQQRLQEEQEHRQALEAAGTALALLGTAAAVASTTATGSPGIGKLVGNLFTEENLRKVITTGKEYTGILAAGESLSVQNTGEEAANQPLPMETHSQHEDTSDSENATVGHSSSDAKNRQEGTSHSTNITKGESQQTTRTDKAVSDLLAVIEKELAQISGFQKEGAYNVAAYLIAGDHDTALSAANLYRSIADSARDPVLHSPIFTWQSTDQTAMLREYLRRGQHPRFRFPNNEDFPQVQLAQMVGAEDMTSYFCLPQTPVPGFIVSSMASFPRDVISRRNPSPEKKSVPIGRIFHMGKEDLQTEVTLDVNDLTKHLFVSGATGVGKSNFCYQLLDQLDQLGIPILVIEPAKGEYRRVLGGRKGFQVYGVDPQREPVLRINPFAYPEGIPTVQHIERLLDIFNTAWPMYSAMPAVLKEAVELAYVEKGFDLITGWKPEGTPFPCFQDLLNTLTKVIDRSKYSAEVKGNYKGALETRVRSLTNGIYGILFSPDELGDQALFDTNVIADISRIGSAETKALLMGVLTSRLVEYRMSEGRMNAPLRHVTVLEEAHNLLRRHNPTSAEGTSARAASVEMLASAIAEMRSSGEGFIIADQSPSVMDWSVIRNTQTKVFFMLPEKEDRRIASNALSLTEVQERELSKLTTGVAAVYQNGWTDAVLCKINYFEKSKEQPFIFDARIKAVDRRLLAGQAIASLLKRRLKPGESSLDPDTVKELLEADPTILDAWGKAAKTLLEDMAAGKKLAGTLKQDAQKINAIVPIGQLLRSAADSEDMESWVRSVENGINIRCSLSAPERQCLIRLGLRDWMASNPGVRKLYVRYLSHLLA